jgi:signal transduction histidine kinase
MASELVGPPPLPKRGRRLVVHLFLWLTVLLVCPTLVLGLFLAERLAESRRAVADRELTLASQAVAREVEILVDGTARTLEAFAARLERVDEPFAEHYDPGSLVRFGQRNPGFLVVYVATPDGVSFDAYPATGPDGRSRAPRSYSDRQYYRELLATGRTTISSVQLGKTSLAPVIILASPIHDPSGKLRGYVAASLDLSILNLQLARVASSAPSTRLLLADSVHQVIAHTDRVNLADMRDLSALPLFRADHEALRDGADHRGDEARASVIQVSARGLGWTVAAYVPRAELDAEAWAARWRAVAAAGITLLLGLVVCAALAAWLSRPIREVAQAAERVGQGDFAVTLHARRGDPREVAQLVDAVSAMARQRQALEAALTDRARELARNLEALHEAQARAGLADRLAAVGTLAAGVAHEINNPTAYVRANVGFALDALRGRRELDEVVRALDEAAEGTERIQRIVRDLQVFGRGDRQAETVEFDPCPIVESAISVTWNELRHKATLVRELSAVAPVSGVPSRLAQVVLNLLVNALQALPEGQPAQQRIRLATRQDGDATVIEVEDTGCGIPAEHLARIFDPFFTTKEVGRGTGLGLAISREIIAGMGGDMRVRSVVGQGTTFEIRLPARPHLGAPAPAPLPPSAPISSGTRARVLVVDDEPAIRSAMGRLLNKHHEVVLAPDANSALELVRGGPAFDAILCDLMMPGKTGVDFYRELAESHPAVAERLMFLTGGVFDPRIAEFLESCQRPCLQKPFDPPALVAAVRDLVDGDARA